MIKTPELSGVFNSHHILYVLHYTQARAVTGRLGAYTAYFLVRQAVTLGTMPEFFPEPCQYPAKTLKMQRILFQQIKNIPQSCFLAHSRKRGKLIHRFFQNLRREIHFSKIIKKRVFNCPALCMQALYKRFLKRMYGKKP
jgi:hypothetical protein